MTAMVKHQRRSFLIILLVLCHGMASAQVIANFTSSATASCSPMVTKFTDSSTGTPTQWKWDLGNGVISTLQNPSVTYFNPGTYTIRLTVSNASGTDSITKLNYITVYANPSIQFSASKTIGCVPMDVKFTDETVAGEGTLVSWFWDLGDGTTSTAQNPTHTYTSAGSYTITLKATNSAGCTKILSEPQFITVAEAVKADFTNSNPGLCPPPSGVQFTNNSTGPAPLSYGWNFGDGATSATTSPLHTYMATGNYTVSLVTTSPQGCKDSISKTSLIKISKVIASFTSPDTVCINKPVTFTSTTNPAPVSYSWTFGNGFSSSAANPITTYPTTGNYTVRVINNFGGCYDTAQKQIFVSPKSIPAFDANQKSFCSLPAAVAFTNQTPGTNNVVWSFGDGGTSTQNDPVHIYTVEGNFTVRLIVTNANGCSDTLIKAAFIIVKKPKLSFNGLPKNGCIPVTITPKVVVTSGHTLLTYMWYFGDGGTSASPAPTYTYLTGGTFAVKLVYTTADGCTDSFTLANAVRTGIKPKASFTYTPTDVCAMQSVTFTNTSVLGNQWQWNFGDGTTSTLQNPAHQYQDTGFFNVRLIVFNNTCPDTLIIPSALHVKPPISRFTYVTDCSNRFTKKFVNKSIGAVTWFWEFGDNTTSTLPNPTHIYTTNGSFLVKLTVSNDTCFHTSTQTIKVVNETALFQTADSAICQKKIATFISSGITPANIKTWYWNFGDLATSATNPNSSHAYATGGVYMVKLRITDIVGCADSMSLPVKVNAPKANFSPSKSVACLVNNAISFTDLTATSNGYPVVKYVWNYGDGIKDSTSPSPFVHSYTTTGIYNVSLAITDSLGCSDTISKLAAIIIAQPTANFFSPDTISCINKPIQFINTSTGDNTVYNWTLGDSTTSTDVHPLHNYSMVGSFGVKVVVTDQYGCADSLYRPNYISITMPTTKLMASDTLGTCPPLLVKFTHISTDYTSRVWDFGDGNTSTLDAPDHFYTTAGIYYTTLTVKGPGGCTIADSQKIVVNGPRGNFTYTPLQGCKPLKVLFTASTQNNNAYTWDFADGSIVLSPDSVMTHNYLNIGDYTPKIILTDLAGCSVPIEGRDTIHVIGSTIMFNMDKQEFCNDGTIQFDNATVVNDPVSSYYWNFGDGDTSNVQHPSHHYLAPGVFTVGLTVTTLQGCLDSLLLKDTVKVYANPIIAIIGDSSACSPASMTYNGVITRGDSALLAWKWNLGNNKTDTVQNPATQVYNIPNTYSITASVIDNHGCKDTAATSITSFPMPTTNAGADSYVCQGSSLQINAIGAATYVWQPDTSLSCTACANPLVFPKDSALYIVTGTNQFGCSTNDSILVRAHYPFTITVGAGDTVCAGSPVRLIANGAQRYTWIPSTGVSNVNAGNTTAVPMTTTAYTVFAKDTVNCFTDTGYVNIKVWPIPKVEAGPDKIVAVGSTLTLEPIYSNDIISYRWNNPLQTLSCVDCPSPTVRTRGDKNTYTIQVKNEGGCTNNDEVAVFAICNGSNLFIPNTFSPNGDGRNETFYPRGSGIGEVKSMHIYNRWGEEVFSGSKFMVNDAAAGWDGKYKGKNLPPDVYIYTCEVICMNYELLFYKGTITLLR